MSAGLLNSILAIAALAALARLLYLPKVQESVTYKATVVPLANIMDVGFGPRRSTWRGSSQSSSPSPPTTSSGSSAGAVPVPDQERAPFTQTA